MSENNIIRSRHSPALAPVVSVAEIMFNRLSELNGDHICVIDAISGRKLTVNELITKSNSIAKALIERGIEKSEIVLTFGDNSIELVIVFFATMFLGITLYPISPIANVYEMRTLLGTLGSITVFTDRKKSEIIGKVVNNKDNKINAKNIVVLDGVYQNYLTFDQLLKEGENQSLPKIPYFKVNPIEDTFLMLQSSGTTGLPKTVMHSHYGYVNQLSVMKTMIAPDVTQEVFGHITPFGCISGCGYLFGNIFNGVSVVFFPQLSEQLVLQSIEKYRINYMFIVPAFGPLLLDGKFVDHYDLSSLVFLSTGGSAFSANIAKALVKKYNIKFQEGYGMSEFGILTDFLNIDPEDIDYIPGSLGRPLINVEMKIRDIRNDKSVGANCEGEICARGPTLFKGYLNNVDATNEAIDSEGWFRTGDIGHYDEMHRIFITDRLKELIKYNTKQVSPTELEQFLMTHKAVAEAAVVGVKHQTESQWPRAYVKVKDNMSVTEEELKKYVSDSLNYAKQLRAGVVFVEHIPRTTVGKVDRRYFKKLIANEIIGS